MWFLPLLSSKHGAREPEVDESVCEISNQLNSAESVLYIEFDAYPEAKLLNSVNLNQLTKRYGSHREVARLLDISEAFVRQNTKQL